MKLPLSAWPDISLQIFRFGDCISDMLYEMSETKYPISDIPVYAGELNLIFRPSVFLLFSLIFGEFWRDCLQIIDFDFTG